MPYRTIAVSLNDTVRTAELLEAASSVARENDAHVLGLYVIPAVQVTADVGMTMVPVTFEGYRDYFKSKLDAVREAFETRCRQDNLKSEWRVVESSYPELATSTIEHACHADLIIVGQCDRGGEGPVETGLAERLVMESGRPVLIVPHKGRFGPRGDGFGEKALVGVNGTRESQRAMFDALPLLTRSKEVRLIWVDPYAERAAAGEIPGAEDATVLARHGITAVAEPMMTNGRNPGEALLMRANDLGADLLVMGAYAHSRLREYVFGGATRHVLEHMTVPVLMSH